MVVAVMVNGCSSRALSTVVLGPHSLGAVRAVVVGLHSYYVHLEGAEVRHLVSARVLLVAAEAAPP